MLQNCTNRGLQHNTNTIFTAKCLHISACVQHFNHACGERLRSCISILVSARKRPQSAHYTRLSGSAPVSFPLCHLAFASETQRGNASEHLSCKHTASCILPPFFCFSHTFASVSLSKPHQSSYLPLLGTSRLLSSLCVKTTCFCLSRLFAPLSSSLTIFLSVSSAANALKRFRGTSLSKMCELLFFGGFFLLLLFYFSRVPRCLFPV